MFVTFPVLFVVAFLLFIVLLGQFLCSWIGRIEKIDFRSTSYSTGCIWIPSLSSVGSSFVVFVFVLFLGAFDTLEEYPYGRRKSVEHCCWRVVVGGLSASAACCAQAHVFATPFPRAKYSFGARGALIRFIVAVVALELVESRRSGPSSSSGVAKKSSITRTAAMG